MKKHDLILIATSSEQYNHHPASATIALATISFWLKEKGILNVALFPEEDVTLLNSIDKLSAFLSGNRAPYIGISCWSNSFTTAVEYSGLIRRVDSNTVIIGGGAHFNSAENIEKALNEKLFDIIFYGGAEPFLDFMSSIAAGKTAVRKTEGELSIDGFIPESGLCRSGHKIPRRGNMTLSAVPVSHLSDIGGHISAMFSDFCSNGCDYCTINMSSLPPEARIQTEQMVINEYKKLKSFSNLPVTVAILDSSPFLVKNKPHTIATLERLSGAGDDITYSIFADPLDFDEEFAQTVIKFNIITFFIGRDRITEDTFVGRRFGGKLRSLEILEKEKLLLTAFLEKMSVEPLRRELYIGYIASPFDTARDADMMIDEIGLYINSAAGNVTVRISMFILNPYIGTKIYKHAADKAWDISEFHYPYPNVWCSADTKIVWLELLRFVISPLFSSGNMPLLGLSMLRFARDYAFGDRKPCALPPELGSKIKDVASKVMDNIINMDLGNEKTLDEWFSHLEELYYSGFMLASIAMNEQLINKYSTDAIMQNIKQYDIMIHPLRKDFKLISLKPLSGTWYGRFDKSN